MRMVLAIAGLMAALSFGSGAGACVPGDSRAAAGRSSASRANLTRCSRAPARHTECRAVRAWRRKADKDGGLNLFGYTVLPKLNFGLDVLYGQDEQQLQLGGTDDIDMLDENGDVSVLGKVKRRF